MKKRFFFKFLFSFQFPVRVPIQTSSTSMITTALNRRDPLREAIVQQKFRFVWNTLWHGNVQQLDQDMDTKSFNNDDQVESVFYFIIYFNRDSLCSRFQTNMILTENDRKYFSLTYTRRTIRLQLNLLNESENHQSAIET